MIPFAPYLRSLETLNVHSCGKVSQDAIVKIAQHSPNLKILIAASWIGGSERGYEVHMGHLGNEAIRPFGQLSNLEIVDITGWSISDYGVSLLLRNCDKLRALNISTCPNITDVGIQVF